MLRVFRSNRLDRLADALAEVLRAPLDSPFDTEWIAVSGLAMRTWLARALALRLGIWAGARFPFPREMIERILFSAHPITDDSLSWKRSQVFFGILNLLSEYLDAPSFSPLREYLRNDSQQLKRTQLAQRIAHTFDEYALYRPEMVLGWEAGQEDHWQAVLWRGLQERYRFQHVAIAATSFFRTPELLSDAAKRFQRISFFAVSHLPPLYLKVLSSLPEKVEVDLFALSPSREWWADLRSREGAALPVDPAAPPGLDQGASDHPLLLGLGRLARDFQWILEETAAYVEDATSLYLDPAQSSTSLLSRIQSDILNLRSPVPEGHRGADDSVRIHSCHSRLREIEVLRDQLLDIFERSKGAIGPGQVAVLALDIDEYTPYIEGVLDRADERIPFTIAAGPLGSKTPLVDVFIRLLDLLGGRLTVYDVFDLLVTESVRRRFGLSSDDVEETRQWIIDAGVRWGIDGAHRRELGVPALGENTWRFGIDRLLLGIALDPEERELFCGVSAAREAGTDEGETLGKLVSFLETLFVYVRRLREPRPVSDWVRDLTGLLGDMTDRAAVTESEYRAVFFALTECASEARATQFSEPVDYVSMRHLVSERLQLLLAKQGWQPGGVCFSSLLPMRSIPFDVIYLLDMNEQSFPRTGRPPVFDLMAKQPKIGDRSLRNDDRYLFLEAILQAKKALVISYVGQSIKDNRVSPPSVLVRDLIDVLETGYGVDRSRIVLEHPLQPLSSRYFGGDSDPRLFSYDRAGLAGAGAVRRGPVDRSRFFDIPISDDNDEDELSLSELSDFFWLPPAYLMKKRLGALFPRPDELVSPREPMGAGGPEERTVRREIIDLLVEGTPSKEVFQHIRSQGLLPLGEAGVARFERLKKETHGLVEEVRAKRAGARLKPLRLDISLGTEKGDTRLIGTVDDLWETGRTVYRLSNGIRGGAVLSCWIHHLALLAVKKEGYPSTSRLMSAKLRGGIDRITFGEVPGDPEQLLADLVNLYQKGCEYPLPLFPDISYELLRRGEKSTFDPREEWSKSYLSKEIALITVFRGKDPFDWEPVPGARFETLAAQVFGPIVAATARR